MQFNSNFKSDIEKLSSTNQDRKTLSRKLDSLVELMFEGKNVSGKNLSPKNKIESLQTDFNSMKQAHQYAKKRVVEALHTDKPYEHMVIIDKKSHKIYGEYKGDKHHVGAGLDWLHMPESCSVIHGHPASYKSFNGTAVSTPISYPDFELLNKFGNDIIAYNKNGEFSLLMRKPCFKKFSSKQAEIYEKIHIAYMNPVLLETLVKKLPKEFQGVTSFKQLKTKIDELKALGKYDCELQAKCKQVIIDYKDELQKLLPNDEFNIGINEIRGIHKFWKDYAEELGVVYKTNYSYL